MKQKVFSWGEDFIIRNDFGEDVFFVDGRALSFGDQLSFQDMFGNELAFIKQKLLSFGPTYELYTEGSLYATVKKELLTFLKTRFTVDVPGPNDFNVQGDFFQHEYSFLRQGKPVARVSKQWFDFTDTYGVDIDPGQNDIIILASSVVIDMVCHGSENNQLI